MPACFSCGSQLDARDKPGRADTCPACDADVHCCRNCQFYDCGSYNECREPQAERVLEKDRSNFCDYFAFSTMPGSRSTAAAPSPARSNPLDRLFKKQTPST
jgi:hypothetical protein